MGMPHYRDARMQHCPVQCPSSLHTGQVFYADCRGYDLHCLRKTDCPIDLDSYRCTPLQQKLREGTCAVPGPRQCPHPPHRGHPGRSGRMACQPCPLQLTWLQRASRQPQGQGGREKKNALVSLEPTCRPMVRAMKCGGDPTQPTYNHQSITDRHQRRLV